MTISTKPFSCARLRIDSLSGEVSRSGTEDMMSMRMSEDDVFGRVGRQRHLAPLFERVARIAHCGEEADDLRTVRAARLDEHRGVEAFEERGISVMTTTS